MGIIDLIAFPFYVLLFHWLFGYVRKSYNDPLLVKYHKQGYWIKVGATIAFTVFNAYLSPGDSVGLYFNEGAHIYHRIMGNPYEYRLLLIKGSDFDQSTLMDPWNAGYFKGESNYLTTKLVALASFVSMGKYMVTNLLFALLAYTGTWKLFMFFYEQYPHLHKRFAIAILYFPTFVFWTSGILKDSLCIASLGWITYALYELFYRKKGLIKNSLILLIFGYLLVVLKVYILISYVPFFMLFIIMKNMQNVKNNAIKFILAPTLIIGSLVGFTKVLNSFGDELGQFAVKDLTKNIKGYNQKWEQQSGFDKVGSNFSLGVQFDGSLSGLVKLTPFAIGTTIFRPFLWESRKPSTMLSSLESLALMLFTFFVLFKVGLFNFMRSVTEDPLVMYCLLFSLVFALFVGASTQNFGSLVRYKIPCLPFYMIAMFMIYEKHLVSQKSKVVVPVEVNIQPELSLAPA